MDTTTTTITTIDNVNDDCPICLENPVSVMGPCSHPLCQPCMEKVVLSSAVPSDNTDDDYHAAVMATPTFGFCPMCRKLLYLFDLRRIVDVSGGGDEKSGDGIGDGKGGDDGEMKNEDDKPVIPTVVAYPPDYHWWNHLGGCDYADEGGTALGLRSFHFPASDDIDGDDDNEESDCNIEEQNHHPHRHRRQPYINYSSPRVAHIGWILDNGSPLPSIKPFDEGSSHYHAESRTFHGRLTWSPSSLNGARENRVVLHFSLDKSVIIGGCFMMDNVVTSSPLDGRWEVRWFRRKRNGTLVEDWDTDAEVITIVAGSFWLFGMRYRLIFDDEDMTRPVYFRWPPDDDNGSVVTQTVVKGVDRVSEPNGPAVGGVVEWATDDAVGNHPLIKWTRQSVAGSDHDVSTPRVMRFGERFGLDYRLCVGDS